MDVLIAIILVQVIAHLIAAVLAVPTVIVAVRTLALPDVKVAAAEWDSQRKNKDKGGTYDFIITPYSFRDRRSV